MQSIPGRKLCLIERAKMCCSRPAQLPGNNGFRSLEIFSFARAAGQGNGQHEDVEQEDQLHVSGRSFGAQRNAPSIVQHVWPL